jgi:PII-like signaling protein
MMVEIVDSLEKMEAFLPVLDEMSRGRITLEKVKVRHYKSSIRQEVKR